MLKRKWLMLAGIVVLLVSVLLVAVRSEAAIQSGQGRAISVRPVAAKPCHAILLAWAASGDFRDASAYPG